MKRSALGQTLAALGEGVAPLPGNATGLMRDVDRLCRSVALRDLGPDDLRLLIGQGIALPWLMPLALVALEVDPMLEADYYPGDLLVAVLRVPSSFWTREAAPLRARVDACVARIDDGVPLLREALAAGGWTPPARG